MKSISAKIFIAAAICLIFVLCQATPVHADSVDSSDTAYTYGDMKQDIKELTRAYPDALHYKVFGKSCDGRNIYCLYLGNRKAKKQIFVTADMHAREYINAQLVMQCVEYYCKNYDTGSYIGTAYKDLFHTVCIVIIPMVNPDGVAIATGGPSAINSSKLRKKLESMPVSGGYSNWQANARGVDLNRNFGNYDGTGSGGKYNTSPCYAYYGGSQKDSEPETWAVMTAMDTCKNVKAYLNIHSMGRTIYYSGTDSQKLAACRDLATFIQSINGYSLVDESASTNDHGDLEHYISKTYGKPYVCIETGTSIPVAHWELSGIYSTHQLLFAKVADKYAGTIVKAQ